MKKLEPYGYSKALFRVLQMRGSLRILAALEEGAKTFSTLKSQVGMSKDTLSRRMRAFQMFGLAEARPALVKNRRTHEYFLPETALAILQFVKGQESRAIRTKVDQQPLDQPPKAENRVRGS